MAESDVDTSRTAVRTYVPAYQREEWDEHADELGMSRSEFVRTMVQAGRRGFTDGAETEATESASTVQTDSESERSASNGGNNADLEDRVVEALHHGDYLSWEELLEAVTDDIEGGLEDALQRLQSEGRVTYSGRNGGYTIDE